MISAQPAPPAQDNAVSVIPSEKIDSRIYLIRGEKVLLDSDLAKLYGVETKTLNRAMQRNPGRFPADFMFQLTDDESEALRCQIGTSNTGRGGRRYLPHVFTEQGVAVFEAIRELMLPDPVKKREMGFHTKIRLLRHRRSEKI